MDGRVLTPRAAGVPRRSLVCVVSPQLRTFLLSRVADTHGPARSTRENDTGLGEISSQGFTCVHAPFSKRRLRHMRCTVRDQTNTGRHVEIVRTRSTSTTLMLGGTIWDASHSRLERRRMVGRRHAACWAHPKHSRASVARGSIRRRLRCLENEIWLLPRCVHATKARPRNLQQTEAIGSAQSAIQGRERWRMR